MNLNFGKWFRNFERSCTLLSKVVELLQLSQLYNFAKLRKLPKVEVDVFLMGHVTCYMPAEILILAHGGNDCYTDFFFGRYQQAKGQVKVEVVME